MLEYIFFQNKNLWLHTIILASKICCKIENAIIFSNLTPASNKVNYTNRTHYTYSQIALRVIWCSFHQISTFFSQFFIFLTYNPHSTSSHSQLDLTRNIFFIKTNRNNALALKPQFNTFIHKKIINCCSCLINFAKEIPIIQQPCQLLYLQYTQMEEIDNEPEIANQEQKSEQNSTIEALQLFKEQDRLLFEEQLNKKHHKWEQMEHRGFYFPPPYQPKKLIIKYLGEEIKLLPHQQEMALQWCKSMGTKQYTNEIYRKNFQLQFANSLKLRYPFATQLNNFDFQTVKRAYDQECQKSNGKREKKKKRKAKKKLDMYYGFAIIDGEVEEVSGYKVENPTLFKGRGKHPKSGHFKSKIKPQEININLAAEAPIPRCYVPGHSWGSIETRKDVTWLCSYKKHNKSSRISYKYLLLAPSSRIKGRSDRKKYRKARNLKNWIQKIRQDYFNKIEQSDIKNKQLGTAIYLIDKLALRVGNEKKSDEADTQGCCTLRVEHIQNLQNDKIKLYFRGKDSILYVNTVPVHPSVWKNIQLFRSKKQPNDDLFDKIDAQDLNDYLKTLMYGLTAKVFRTYNASVTLQQELNDMDLYGLSKEEKMEIYHKANQKVAILCNHKKIRAQESVGGLNLMEQFIDPRKRGQLIDHRKQHRKELEQYKKQFTAENKTVIRDIQLIQLRELHKQQFTSETQTTIKMDEIIQIDGLYYYIQSFPTTKQDTEMAIKQLKKKIRKEQKQMKDQIALGTSKASYNDPRISVAWCNRNNLDIEQVFPKSLLKKFAWAMNVDDDFKF